MQVPFSFLTEQFKNPEPIFDKIRDLLKRCDFTLGEDLARFEKRFAQYCGVDHAIAVGTGTDAIALALKVSDISFGDEVITPANSFVATTGAIIQVGAKPVFVDAGKDFNINCDQIEATITPQTRAILPVHWAGRPADMESVYEIARKKGLIVVEDCCQALGARVGDRHVGTFGAAGAFSLHPIKPLHVWGDGGVVITRSAEFAKKLLMLRNHGLENRDVVRVFGVNSRMDTLQAVVANYVFDSLDETIDKRVGFSKRYNAAFKEGLLSDRIQLAEEQTGNRNVCHLYQIRVEDRDALLLFLINHGIEAKVHYPIPLHLQPAASDFGYKRGDFPKTEDQSDHTITLPCHQYLTEEHIDYVIDQIKDFYTA